MSVRLASSNNKSKEARPSRSAERVALAQAIESAAALKAALDENKADKSRVEEARHNAFTATEKATEALERAKTADAEAIAEGRTTGALKAARVALTDAEDAYESCKTAEKVVADRRKDLDMRAGLADGKVKAAVTAVLQGSPEVARLLERYRAARQEFHDVQGMLPALFAANVLPRELEVAISSYNISEVIHKDLPPSPLEAKVQAWITALHQSADAVLE
jgi:hypothetical protein